MSDSAEQPVHPGEHFWKEHILTAANFIGSDQEYCRRNGLNPVTFSNHKVKLGFSKHKRKPTQAFVKIEPKTSASVSGASPAHSLQKTRSLPDAKWTAEFIAALMSQR